MHQIITSTHNPKVAFWRGLKSRAARREAQLYLVEGVKMVEEAIVMGLAESLLIDMDRQADYLPLSKSAICPVYLVSPHILSSVCDTKTPQGIAAVVKLSTPPMQTELGPMLISLDGVQDPGNVGTILRTADAAGFSGALLSEECADPYSPKCLRATMGSIFRMKILTVPSLPDVLKSLRGEGYSLLSGELNGSPFYSREDAGNRFILIIGSEGNGVSQEVSSLCTQKLALPMRGGAESLNAAVAAGIMMYDLVNRQ